MSAPKILKIFRWEVSVLILCSILGVGYIFIDTALRRMEYQVLELDYGPFHAISLKGEYLVAGGWHGSIEIYTLSNIEHVWSGKGPKNIHGFVHCEDSEYIFLIGDGLGILSNGQNGWNSRSRLTRSDLKDLGVMARELQFNNKEGRPTDYPFSVLDIDGRFILGKFEAGTQEFIPFHTYQTRDFILIRDQNKSGASRKTGSVYRIAHDDEEVLHLIHCDEWTNRGMWPGSMENNLFLKTGHEEVKSIFGETVVETLDLISIENCSENRMMKRFKGGFYYQGGAISSDGNNLFAISHHQAPVEYGTQDGGRVKHRNIVGRVKGFFGKYAVTSSAVDWDNDQFYLMTSHRHLYIGELKRPK